MAFKLTRLKILALAFMVGPTLVSPSLAADAGGSSNDTATVSSSDLIGWFNCSAITFADQRNAADSFLQNSGFDFGNKDPFTLNAFARRAQCVQYQAPLCHAGICEDAQGRTIDVFVKRVLARSSPETRPNVWFLQGGPGYASPTMEYAMRALYIQLDGLVNVYTMDHRGTGRSTPLNCVAAQATTSGSPLGADIDVSEVAACAQELQTKYGDLAAFSITSAASDLSRFITTFQTGSKTFVYGVSYGSALVERLMHLGTKEVVGYILDGVSTTSGADAKDGMYMSNWDTNFGEVGDHFLDLISTDSVTAGKFGSKSVSSALQSVLSALDSKMNSKCAKAVTSSLDVRGSSAVASTPSGLVRRFLGRLLMYSVTRGIIPAIIYRLQRCDDEDAKVLKYAFKKVPELLDAPSEEEVLVSTLEYYLIVFSEMWETPTPDMATMTTRFTNAKISTGPIADLLPLYCAFTKDSSSACSAVVNATSTKSGPPLAYQKDKYWNTAATIPTGASVLILSGKLDPQTPHKYAERLLAALDGAQKELVTFEYTAHGALFEAVYSGSRNEDAGMITISLSRYCAVEVLASYVTANGDVSKIDTRCVALTNAERYTLGPDQLYGGVFLGTTDVFEGEVYTYTDTDTRLTTPLIIVSVVGGILLLIASCYFCEFQSRRRKARAKTAALDRARARVAAAAAASSDGVQGSPTSATTFQRAQEEPLV